MTRFLATGRGPARWVVAAWLAVVVASACSSSSSTVASSGQHTKSPSAPSAVLRVPTAPTASSAPAPLGECDLRELSLGVTEQGAGGAAVIGVDLSSIRRPCHVDTHVTATLEDAQQHPLNVVGNGLDIHAVGDLPTGPELAIWLWSNWCGSPETEGARVRMELGSGAMVVDASLAVTARCDESSYPSTLRTIPK